MGVYCFGLLWCEQHSRPVVATPRHWDRTWQQTEGVTLVTTGLFWVFSLPPTFPIFPSWPHLESKSIFLCCEVCVFLVPFAWGQALFSVDVLRVYPNVQDLGVSARLSESGEKKKKEQDSFISNCCGQCD